MLAIRSSLPSIVCRVNKGNTGNTFTYKHRDIYKPKSISLSSNCEDAVNKQISKEYEASIFYESMYYFYNRPYIALPGFASFFRKASEEEKEHARLLGDYMNRRHGRVIVMRSVTNPFFEPPSDNIRECALYGMRSAWNIENENYDSLIELHKIAENENDVCLADFVGEHLLRDQVDAVYAQTQKYVQLKRLLSSKDFMFGLYEFEKQL